MGRISRRNQIAELNETGSVSTKTAFTIYRTAVYARLSVEDIKTNSDSIATQVFFIKKYIEERPELSYAYTFTDNGFTGTNFQRPGFEEMMCKIREGEINCVIVKDLSRLGRNYIEAGTYIENIFPFLGVRFISINDNYDSINPMDSNKYFSLSIKNLSNEFVARDISRKVQSVFNTKQKNGEFIGSYAAHGYMKSPEDKHKLIVDPETAPVIVRIFNMRAEGLSYRKIADILNVEGIESPGAYKIRKGLMKQKYNNEKPLWNYTRICEILKNPIYIGNLAQKKFSRSKLDGGPLVKHKKEEWIVVENTHEPIISMDVWKKVQKMFEETKKYYDENFGKYSKGKKLTENIFKRKIVCGECGYAIIRSCQYRKNGKPYYLYYCNHKNKDGQYCSSKMMFETKLFDAVYKAVRLQMNLCMDYKKIIADLETKSDIANYSNSLNSQREKLIAEKGSILSKKALLYDEYADGIISKEDYLMISSKYDDEVEMLSIQISAMEKQISNRRVMLSRENDWIVAFDKFRSKRKLSKDMVDALIKRIIIKSKTEIEVEFYYRDEFEMLVNGLKKIKEEVGYNG